MALLKVLKGTFDSFASHYPDAAEHLEIVEGNCNISYPYLGEMSGDGLKIILKAQDWEDVNETFVHELGHLLHLYFENSSLSKIIYNFTRKCRPRKRTEAPSAFIFREFKS